MLNQVVLVGRLTNIEKLEEGANIVLAVQRSFKNANGEYEADMITCRTFGAVADNTAEYCKRGDIIGAKGRIQTEDDKLIIVAEKITFLSSNSNK